MAMERYERFVSANRDEKRAAPTKDNDKEAFTAAALSKGERIIRLWKQAGYTVILFLMLLEWLVPLRNSNLGNAVDLDQISPLVLSIACSLIIGLWIRRPAASYLMRVFAIVMITAWAFGVSQSGSTAGWSGAVNTILLGIIRIADAIGQDIGMVYSAITGGEWLVPSGEMRTLLLLTGMSLVAALVQSLVLQHHSILWFSGATLLYLVVLQGAVNVNTTGGIIRTVAWTASLLSWLHLEQLTAEDRTYKQRAWPLRWWFTTMAVSFAIVTGFVLWQQVYDWERPHAWERTEAWIRETAAAANLTNSSAAHALGNQAVTGYSSDDSKLGAPVKQDHRVLFRAVTPEPTYWKVETKSTYTGQGWEASVLAPELVDGSGRLTTEIEAHQEKVWSKPFTQTVTLAAPLSPDLPLVFGGRPERLTEWRSGDASQVELAAAGEGADTSANIPSITYDPALERFSYKQAGSSTSSKIGVVVTYSYQTKVVDKPQLLKDAPFPAPSNEQQTQFLAKYTELPSQLPDRVLKLADDITAGAESQREKVERIQTYLMSHYAYTLDQSTAPPRGQDFVDHFLFDQRQGYCNHFSTAMAVLLRAEGIPTRWVKGFTPGIAEAEGQYTIRASDAHSWVEVFYPEAGWVPYEATPTAPLTAAVNLDASILAGADVRASAVLASDPAGAFLPVPLKVRMDKTAEPNDVWGQLNAWTSKGVEQLEAGKDWLNGVVSQMGDSLRKEREFVTDAASWSEWFGERIIPSAARIQEQAKLWWNSAPVTATSILLTFLLLTTLLLRRMLRFVRRVWPRMELAYLIRLQQRRYRADRLPRMGRLAWLLLERRFGQMPANMTLEEYASDVGARHLPEEEAERLRQFAADSGALLFAKHNGERAQRQRFIAACGDMLRISQLPPQQKASSAASQRRRGRARQIEG
ncbi:transglutaminase family protein [Paenibacillus marinisediminis]